MIRQFIIVEILFLIAVSAIAGIDYGAILTLIFTPWIAYLAANWRAH